MCNMSYGTFECRGDGYLWDADSDGYDLNDLSLPCPQCNTLVYLEYAKEEAESTSHYQIMTTSGRGVDIWENAVERASLVCDGDIEEKLRQIKSVTALYEVFNEVFEKNYTYK